MAKFYVTFGQHYRHEPHPQGGHPDGYAVVEADDLEGARQEAFKRFDSKWAFVYTWDNLAPENYPRGEICCQPAPLTDEEKQDLNLDCMDETDLEGLLPRLEAGKELIDVQLWTYAYLKIGAIKWRKRGVIAIAQALERNCESIYKELPSRYLW